MKTGSVHGVVEGWGISKDRCGLTGRVVFHLAFGDDEQAAVGMMRFYSRFQAKKFIRWMERDIAALYQEEEVFRRSNNKVDELEWRQS